MDTALSVGHFDLLVETVNGSDANCNNAVRLMTAVKPDTSFMDTVLMMCGVECLPIGTEPAVSVPDQSEVKSVITGSEMSCEKQSKLTGDQEITAFF